MPLTSRALAFASRWFDERTVTSVFEPLIADWQREWNDSAPSHRAWVTTRGLAAFVCAATLASPRTLIIATPRPVTQGVVAWIVRFTAITTTLIALITSFSQPELLWTSGLIVFVIPSIIAAIFPFAMAGAIDAVRRDRALPPHVERAAALKVTLFAVIFMIAFGGWVAPLASREYRLRSMALAGRSGPPPGVRELTTFELIADPDRTPEHEAFSGGADRTARIRGELQSRASLAALPIVLIWLRWRALGLPRRRWVGPLPATAATTLSIAAFFALFFYGFDLEHELRLARGSGAWLPIAALTCWGLIAQQFRRLLLLLADVHPVMSLKKAHEALWR